MPHLLTRAAWAPLALLVVLAGCDAADLAADSADAGTTADAGTMSSTPRAGSQVIADQYIVLLDASVGQSAVESRATAAADAVGGRVIHTYDTALRGFAVRLPDAAAAAALAHQPGVREVVPDAMAYPTTTQSSAPYNLDRMDQRSLPLSTTYNYDKTGSGVTVYVIDSGIRTSHTQFGGRAAVSADFIGDGQNGQDCNGHGTHVAGTVGGSVSGAAKGVALRSVRVFGCTGGSPWSTIIAGIDWVAANAQTPAVANMSLGGPANSAIDQAVQGLVNAGVTATVSAGNDYNTDACTKSPARFGPAITVGSTTSSDARSDFSNTGTCLDLWAPGSSVVSASHTSNTGTTTKSGTSMAAPLVAGAAAIYLQSNPTASPASVASFLTSQATTGKVTGGGSSPNRLLYVAPAPVAPTASLSFYPPTRPPGGGNVEMCLTVNNAPTSFSTYNWSINGQGSTTTTRCKTFYHSGTGAWYFTSWVNFSNGTSVTTSANY